MTRPTQLFVVYHIASTMEVRTFKVRAAAIRHALKLNAEKGELVYDAMEREQYRSQVVKMVTRKNLMTGQEYQEPSNTPGYMSPASEAYWTM